MIKVWYLGDKRTTEMFIHCAQAYVKDTLNNRSFVYIQIGVNVEKPGLQRMSFHDSCLGLGMQCIW